MGGLNSNPMKAFQRFSILPSWIFTEKVFLSKMYTNPAIVTYPINNFKQHFTLWYLLPLSEWDKILSCTYIWRRRWKWWRSIYAKIALYGPISLLTLPAPFDRISSTQRTLSNFLENRSWLSSKTRLADQDDFLSLNFNPQRLVEP